MPDLARVSKAVLSHSPKPGSFYRVRKGDSLLKVAGKAYGVGQGARRLSHAKRVNRDPFNRRYWRPPHDEFSRRHFADGVVSFSPQFACEDVVLLDQTGAHAPKGNCFALLWLPPAPVAPADLWIDIAAPAKPPVPKGPGGKVADSLAEPYSWLCYVQTEYDDPDGGSVPIRRGGTGVLIGHRHLLTAAHVVYPVEVVGTGAHPTAERMSPNKIEVLQAMHSAADGRIVASNRFAGLTNAAILQSQWIAAPDFDHDFALLDLGSQAQANGWWGASGGFPVSAGVNPASLVGRTVHVAGYASAYMFFDSNLSEFTGRVEAVGAGLGNTAQHRARTFEGMSGGPVWTVTRTGGRRVATLVGINSSLEQRTFDFREFLLDPGGPIEVSIRSGISEALLLTPYVLNRLRKHVPQL